MLVFHTLSSGIREFNKFRKGLQKIRVFVIFVLKRAVLQKMPVLWKREKFIESML